MATLKFGAAVVDIRGSIGGWIFARNANASYAKRFTKPTNPDTGGQQEVRGIFSEVSQAWKDLSDAERNAWVEAAALSEWSYLNKVGEVSYYTGSQLFNKLNGQLRQLNPVATLFSTPPTALSLTAIYQLSFIPTDDPTEGFFLSVNNSVDLPAGQQVKVYSTGPVSPGVYRPKGSQFKLLGTFPTAGSGTPDIEDVTTAYLAKFGALVIGQNIWCKVETYAPATGQTIPGSMEKAVVIAA